MTRCDFFFFFLIIVGEKFEYLNISVEILKSYLEITYFVEIINLLLKIL